MKSNLLLLNSRRKFYLGNILFFLSFSLLGQIPSGYYDSANGKTGADLKTALYQIIKNPSVTSYSGLYTSFLTTDVKPNGKVWDMYSDVPSGTPPYEYSYGSGTCGNYSKEGDCYNREHSFPQSWFNSSSPMVSDLFHLYPTDGKVNGIRSNFPYGEVGTASTTTQNGSKLGASKSPGYSSTVFEPIDEYKGDLARGILYIATCYENLVAGWQSNGNANEILAGNSYPAFDKWQLDLLAKWHLQDPVSTKEINRNNAAYKIQGNRNPFIDHPEYAGLIWGFSTISGINNCTGTTPTIQVANISISGIEANKATISWTNGNGIGRILKINTSNSFTDLVDGSNYAANSSVSGISEQVIYSSNGNKVQITGLNTLTSYYVKGYEYACSTLTGKLYANASSTNNPVSFTTTSISSGINISASGTSLLSEDFAICPASGWQTLVTTGTKNWFCNAAGYMEANGFINASSTPSQEAWLISPSFNSLTTTGITVAFNSATRYSDNVITNPQISVYYSTNYSGSGSPIAASWTAISGFTYPSSNSDINASVAWINSGVVTINGVKSANMYLGFKYASSGSGSNSSTRWRVDNIEIKGLTTTSGSVDAPINHAPVVNNITLSGFNTDTLKGNVTGFYFDQDEEELFLTTELNEETSEHGSITISTDGTIKYKALNTFTGIDSFIYTVCDVKTCTSGLIYFNVTKNNHTPIANNFTLTGWQSTTISGSLSGKYLDPDNDNLTITSFTNANTNQNGQASINASGLVTYVPSQNFFGLDTVTYQICDGELCASANIVLKVKQAAPILLSNTYVIKRNLAFSGSIDSLVNNPKNGSISIQPQLITSVGGSTFQLKLNGDFTYIPKVGYSGSESFSYTACNADTCNTALLVFSIPGISTGIHSFEESVSLYPQPATNELTINSLNGEILSLCVSNVVGEKVLEYKHLNTTTLLVDLAQLNTGAYFLTLTFNNFTITKRLFVTK